MVVYIVYVTCDLVGRLIETRFEKFTTEGGRSSLVVFRKGALLRPLAVAPGGRARARRRGSRGRAVHATQNPPPHGRAPRRLADRSSPISRQIRRSVGWGRRQGGAPAGAAAKGKRRSLTNKSRAQESKGCRPGQAKTHVHAVGNGDLGRRVERAHHADGRQHVGVALCGEGEEAGEEGRGGEG